MSEWQANKLGDVCSQVLTGGTPLTNNSAYFENGSIPWLKTKEVNFCRITNTEYFITEQGLANSAAKLVPANSVIVAMYGQGDTAGRVAINKIPLATNQACCNLVINATVADYQFIYYFLKNSYVELVQRKTGSAQPNLNTKLIKDFEILLPPLPEQEAITAVLASLDDKIDLLHRQNKTLEALAQTLFRHWFIDGAEDDWEEIELGTITNLKYGKFLPIKDLNGGPYPVYSGYSVVGYHDDFLYSEPQLIMVCRGVGGSGDVKISPPNCWITNLSIVIQSTEDWLSQNYLYWALETSDRTELITGSVQSQVTINHLAAHVILKPPTTLLKRFDQISDSLNSKISLNKGQIRTLEKLRDTLLPKLMSGEVRVHL